MLITSSIISKSMKIILALELNIEKSWRAIIPDCDCGPSVVIDDLACSCIQHLTATTPEVSNRAAILKGHMKELFSKVLLLS